MHDMHNVENDRMFSFRLPARTLAALWRQALEEDRTAADIVRRAVREYLGKRVEKL